MMFMCGPSSLGMTALSDAFASIALPAGATSAQTSTPLIGSAWRLSLNLGFVDDDHAAQRMGYVAPPKEWAASGARHPPLHVDVRFEEDQAPHGAARDRAHEWMMAPHGWSGADLCVSPLASARFVGMNGEEAVTVGGGDARLTPVPHARSSMMHLRFGLELGADVSHRDVTLPAGARLVLCTDCWSDRGVLRACVEDARGVEQEKGRLEACALQVQEALSSRPLEAVRVLLKEGWLPDRIFNKRLELSERKAELPDAQSGTVQGPGQLAMARSGLVCVAREQSKALGIFGRTVYETVGTFSIRDDAGS